MNITHRDHLLLRAVDDPTIYDDCQRAREWLAELDRPDSADLAAIMFTYRFVTGGDPRTLQITLDRFRKAWPEYSLFQLLDQVMTRGIDGYVYLEACLSGTAHAR